MKKIQLRQYEDHIKQYDDSDLTEFPCPQCKNTIKTLLPKEQDYYDSLCTCPHCGNIFFKIVYSDGRVEIKGN